MTSILKEKTRQVYKRQLYCDVQCPWGPSGSTKRPMRRSALYSANHAPPWLLSCPCQPRSPRYPFSVRFPRTAAKLWLNMVRQQTRPPGPPSAISTPQRRNYISGDPRRAHPAAAAATAWAAAAATGGGCHNCTCTRRRPHPEAGARAAAAAIAPRTSPGGTSTPMYIATPGCLP